jgi:hypothetical protein
MKIKMKSFAITPYGSFNVGQVLTDQQYQPAFLVHLVNEANAADFIEYETKVIAPDTFKTEPAVEVDSVEPKEETPRVSRKKSKRRPSY